MVHPPPGDIGDVQEPIDAAQIDEHAVVGDVLHHSAGDLPFLQAAEGRRLLLLVLHLHDGAAREHDVVSFLVEGDDLEFVLVAAQRVEILHRLRIDERPGQKRLHSSHVDRETALDSVDDAALDGLIRLICGLDPIPDQHPLGFLTGKDDVTANVFQPLEKDIDLVAGLDLDLAAVGRHLADGQKSF